MTRRPPAVDIQIPDQLNASASLILSTIWNEGPISRTHLADRTGLAHSSITRLTRVLERLDLIRAVEVGESTGGRPPILLAFNENAGVVITVDLSTVNLRGAVYNVKGENLATIEHPFQGFGEERIQEQIITLLDELSARCKRLRKRVMAIAISVPGTVDVAEGIIVDVTNLSLRDFHIGDILRDRFHLPVLVEHDTIAAAYAERYYGAGRASPDMIYVTVSQGIGAGILLNNQLYRGETGEAGEIGHVTILRDGPPCLCGRRGCLEALAGATAIVQQTREALVAAKARGEDSNSSLHALDEDALTIEAISEAAARGDAIAAEVVARAADYVAQAVGTLVCILNTRTVIVGGEITAAGPAFFGPLAQCMPLYQLYGYPATVVQAELGQDAPIKGVSMLALEQVFGLTR